MPEYRIRYIVGYYDVTGKPVYHSVVVLSDEAPNDEQALDAASLQELHLYQDQGAAIDEIELDEIRELAPIPAQLGRVRARYVFDFNTNEWFGPIFEGRSHDRIF